MLNVALIGLGWWGQTHIRALHEKSDKINIDTVVDLNSDLSEKTASGIGARTAPSFEAVLADDTIDAIILVTPHDHCETVCSAWTWEAWRALPRPLP